MNLAQLLKLVHIASAFWLIAGILGRNLVFATAGRSTDLKTVLALVPLGGVFDRRMVIPGSNAVLIAGLLTAWAQGWPILGSLQGGRSNWVFVSLLLMLSLIPVITLVFQPRGRVFEQALRQAEIEARVTPELSAAMQDPLVRAAHVYELVVLAVIVTLMVLKPF